MIKFIDMSLYNMINGVNPATFFILPMLGKHAEEYPRFRDCFTRDEEHPEYDDHIHIYTRTGGGNREGYVKENQEMREHPNFITDFDDSFDSTYASWVFSIPEKWKDDYDLIKNQDILNISDEYKQQLYKVYPKLKETFDKIFNKK